jgi:hypothetical protein
MKPSFNNINIGYYGALISTAAIFLYALVVMIYVIVRSSNFIFSAMPAGERAGIMVANGFAVAYSVAVFSIVMAIVSSAVGATSAIIIKWSLVRFNNKSDMQRAVFMSGAVAMMVLVIVYIILRTLLKGWMTWQYPETLFFWFGIPAVLFFGACVVGGTKLNELLKRETMH